MPLYYTKLSTKKLIRKKKVKTKRPEFLSEYISVLTYGCEALVWDDKGSKLQAREIRCLTDNQQWEWIKS